MNSRFLISQARRGFMFTRATQSCSPYLSYARREGVHGVPSRAFSQGASPSDTLPAGSLVKKLLLMRSMRFSNIAVGFAKGAQTVLAKGGIMGSLALTGLRPLATTFSIGDSVGRLTSHPTYKKNPKAILLDYVEEMNETEEERENAFNQVNKLLEETASEDTIYYPLKVTAIIDDKLLRKISNKEILTSEEQKQYGIEFSRFNKLVAKAARLGKQVFIDQEYPTQKEAIFNIGQSLMRQYNQVRPVVYMTIQATDKECFELLDRLLTDPQIGHKAIKIVNGAYVNWAHDNGYGDMMQDGKMRSFLAYIQMAKYLIDNGIHAFFGTHNLKLEALLDQFMAKYPENRSRWLKGQLLGFESKEPECYYALYGRDEDCIEFALRRVVEGACSRESTNGPQLTDDEVRQFMLSANNPAMLLNEEEVAMIREAMTFDPQSERIRLAGEELKRAFGLG